MLSDAQWRSVRDIGFDLLDAEGESDPYRAELECLLRLVPAEVAGSGELDLVTGAGEMRETPDLLIPLAVNGVEEVLAHNPGMRHLAERGDLAAVRAEQIPESGDWARNPWRRELLDPVGLTHAVVIGHRLPGGRVVQGWGVNRDRPFRDDEVEMLQALDPALRRAARARRRREVVLHLDRAVAEGAGLVIFGPVAVVYRNAEADELLERHRVALATLRGVTCGQLSPGRPEGSMSTAVGILRLQRRPALPGCSAVVLDEVGAGHRVPGGLTPRQLLALGHLGEGRTAAAIARLMGVSERTVHKHLENLYRTLGVGDRLSAVLKGRELGLLPVLDPAVADPDA
ncbi:response regulator transcription factor [Kineococcus gynurae]|uniref:Response regulator transcription factor n=1 Tax=Kineococcus gynurae TaxID=452979 RepID=A0ABV5LNG9_9ACTN